jgi:nicotinamide riboside kinase
MMKKIVVLGPESTGKSTLCAQLAAHYKSSWVPEYARTYLQDTNNSYVFEDLWEIAQGQKLSIENAEKNYWLMHPEAVAEHAEPYPLFIDTDLQVIRIWSEISFNKCDHRLLNRIASAETDLFLLCNTDLPWEPDPLREYPDLAMRQRVYAYYKDTMVNQPITWIDISGDYEERFFKAAKAVDALLSGN